MRGDENIVRPPFQHSIDDVHDLAFPFIVEMNLRLIEKQQCVTFSFKQMKQRHARQVQLFAVGELIEQQDVVHICLAYGDLDVSKQALAA